MKRRLVLFLETPGGESVETLYKDLSGEISCCGNLFKVDSLFDVSYSYIDDVFEYLSEVIWSIIYDPEDTDDDLWEDIGFPGSLS